MATIRKLAVQGMFVLTRRDGQPADCILMYRPADMVRLSSITAYELSAQDKGVSLLTVHGMLDYAQSPLCRSVFFARYFEDPTDTLQPCGSCDNCKRGPPNTLVGDVSFAAWQTVQMAAVVSGLGGRPTFTLLADLASGRGRGMFTDATGSSVRYDDTASLGHTSLTRANCERLLIQLLVERYLQEDLGTLLLTVANAFNVNVYLVPGRRAHELLGIPTDSVRTISGAVRMVLGVDAPRKRKIPKSEDTPPEKHPHVIELDSD